jgi:type II secretory pathway pseudopilin PulG
MHVARRGITVVEVVAAIAILSLIMAVLLPMSARSRNADFLQISEQNVATILVATHMYTADHAAGAPLRACGYTQGQVSGGWDGWNFGGKDCDAFYTTYTGGVFDEPAYARPLNEYIYPARIARPQGYVNSGSGSTWTFNHGHPAAAERAALQMPVFHSPGDTRSYERSWPTATTTISGYDDFGTSYVLNMKWWDDPTMAALGFTARYIEGSRRLGLALAGGNPNCIWVCDQIGDVVPYLNSPSVPGEFGKTNYSVMGWVDGRVGYIPVAPNQPTGPGYTFFP